MPKVQLTKFNSGHRSFDSTGFFHREELEKGYMQAQLHYQLVRMHVPKPVWEALFAWLDYHPGPLYLTGLYHEATYKRKRPDGTKFRVHETCAHGFVLADDKGLVLDSWCTGPTAKSQRVLKWYLEQLKEVA